MLFARNREVIKIDLDVPTENFFQHLAERTLPGRLLNSWKYKKQGVYLTVFSDGFAIHAISRRLDWRQLLSNFNRFEVYGTFLNGNSIVLHYRLRLPYYIGSILIHSLLITGSAIAFILTATMMFGFSIGTFYREVSIEEPLTFLVITFLFIGLPFIGLVIEDRLNDKQKREIIELVAEAASIKSL